MSDMGKTYIKIDDYAIIKSISNAIDRLTVVIDRKFPDDIPLEGIRRSRLVPNMYCPVCGIPYVTIILDDPDMDYICKFGHKWAQKAKDTPNLPDLGKSGEKK